MMNFSSKRDPILEKIHEKNENSDASSGDYPLSKKRSSQRNKENNPDKLNSSSFSKHSKKSISKKSKNSFQSNKAEYRNFHQMMMEASGIGMSKHQFIGQSNPNKGIFTPKISSSKSAINFK